MKYSIFIGLDVHKNTISVAIAYAAGGEVIFMGVIPNTPDAIMKLVKKLGKPETLYFCYEAGPCGYEIHRQLTKLGATCIVVAPSLIPTKPGDRIKNDHRDAKKLARLLRNGDLTPVYVPTRQQEAMRDILRIRQDAVKDHTRKRNQLSMFLLRNNLRPPEGVNPWTKKHRLWLDSIKFKERAQQICLTECLHAIDEAKAKVDRLEKEIILIADSTIDVNLLHALQALRGVGLITAATLIAEIGDFTRFDNPEKLMAYAGIVPGEHSSGQTRRQGRITKTGNGQIRFVLVESSWCYRFQPRISTTLKKRQAGLSEEVKAIAWKAQHRLHHKYRLLMAKDKPRQKVITGVARELLGFAWAIAIQVAKESVKVKVA
ncbi:MAG TPA: IS110 family transposase [Bacillota bacterium]|nr:IS110 family transposase [Bacillota bacterium]